MKFHPVTQSVSHPSQMPVVARLPACVVSLSAQLSEGTLVLFKYIEAVTSLGSLREGQWGG